MDNTKVRVKKEYIGLKEILPLGFETELIAKHVAESKKLVNETTKYNPATGRHEIINPAVFSSVGDYDGFTFKGANDLTYNDKTIVHMIGNVALSVIFEKI